MLKVPADAYCVVGVMMTDIYHEGTNFGTILIQFIKKLN